LEQDVLKLEAENFRDLAVLEQLGTSEIVGSSDFKALIWVFMAEALEH